MYLELSPRQVGKTTRLIKAVEKHLSNPQNYACLTFHKMAYGKDIVRKIDSRFHERISYKSTFRNHDNHLRGHDVRLKFFFDEFDFFSKLEDVPVIEDGYYCTTGKFTRKIEHWENWGNDPLLRLLVANDFIYTSTHGMKPFFDAPPHKLDDMKRQLGEDHFKCEFQNTFDDMWGSGHKKTFREMGQ